MTEKTPVGLKLVGFYRGIVKAHSPNGKCKIFWPGVTPAEWFEDDEKLSLIPDAEQAAPLFASGGDGNGTFCYPEVGTTVWGFFENGDANFPVYFATTLSFNDNSTTYNDELKWDLLKSRRDKRIIKVDEFTITINSENESVVVDNGVGHITLSKDGKISLDTSNDIDIVGNNVNIMAVKNLNLVSTNTTNTAAETIESFSQNHHIRTTGGGTSIKGDLPFYGIQVW